MAEYKEQVAGLLARNNLVYCSLPLTAIGILYGATPRLVDNYATWILHRKSRGPVPPLDHVRSAGVGNSTQRALYGYSYGVQEIANISLWANFEELQLAVVDLHPLENGATAKAWFVVGPPEDVNETAQLCLSAETRQDRLTAAARLACSTPGARADVLQRMETMLWPRDVHEDRYLR